MDFNSKYIVSKSKNIKAILTDIDGVLTDGKLYYQENENGSVSISKTFSVKDGQLVKHIKSQGIILGAITGRSDKVADVRIVEHLKFDFYRHGSKDKMIDYNDFKDMYNLKDENIIYIGDDLIDLNVLNIVGLSICPKDSIEKVKSEVDYVSSYKGGEGVFREAIDILLLHNNKEIEF
jgi:3-deoxy-D-manno-octulosonate 8-phosphate phosphatase (KDO 8-P phosphatase)